MNQPASKGESVSKTYKREYLTSMITYAVMLIVSAFLIKHVPSSPGWSIPLGLIPMMPLFFAVRAFLRFFHRRDELQRRIRLEALALCCVLTCVFRWWYGLRDCQDLP